MKKLFIFREMELSSFKLKKLLHLLILSVGRTFRNKGKISKVTIKGTFIILVRASRQKKTKFSKQK